MLFLRALHLLIVYDVLCTFSNFARIRGMVKKWPVARKPYDGSAVNRVSTAVNYACIWYPKQALCLQRAFVMAHLLRREGIAAEMVLGAQKLPFKAHAWVEVDGRAVNETLSVQMTYAVWDRC
jgi:hypothetical protein